MASIIFPRDELGIFLDVIEFDATLNETYHETAMITEHPVEEGQNVNDYVKPQLTKLKLVGTITNTPIQSTPTPDDLSFRFAPIDLVETRTLSTSAQRLMFASAQSKGGMGFHVNPPGFKLPHPPLTVTPAKYDEVGIYLGFLHLVSPTAVDRVTLVYKKLVELKNKGQEIKVVTSLVTYENILIRDITVDRSEAEDSIDITLDLVQFLRVSTASVAVRVAAKPKKVKAAEDRNDKAAPTATASGTPQPEENIRTSGPRSLVDFYRSWGT